MLVGSAALSHTNIAFSNHRITETQLDLNGYLHCYCIWSRDLSLLGKDIIIPPIPAKKKCSFFLEDGSIFRQVSIQTQSKKEKKIQMKAHSYPLLLCEQLAVWHIKKKKLMGVILQSAAIKQLQKKRAH